MTTLRLAGLSRAPRHRWPFRHKVPRLTRTELIVLYAARDRSPRMRNVTIEPSPIVVSAQPEAAPKRTSAPATPGSPPPFLGRAAHLSAPGGSAPAGNRSGRRTVQCPPHCRYRHQPIWLAFGRACLEPPARGSPRALARTRMLVLPLSPAVPARHFGALRPASCCPLYGSR